MATFDYNAEAELFPPRLRKSPHQRFGYRRFAASADAVRFAVEELPRELLIGAILEVDGERYGGEQTIAPVVLRSMSHPLRGERSRSQLRHGGIYWRFWKEGRQ